MNQIIKEIEKKFELSSYIFRKLSDFSEYLLRAEVCFLLINN